MPRTTAPAPTRQAALVHEFGVPGMSADAELDGLVRAAAAVTGQPWAAVNTLDTPVKHALAAHGFRATATPRTESVCAALLRRGPGVRSVDDLRTDPELAGNPWVDGTRWRLRAYACAPLVVDGELLGALSVFGEEPHAFTAAEHTLLGDLAAVVLALFESRRQAGQLADVAATSQLARAEMARTHAELARSEAFVRALLEVLPVAVVGGDAERRVDLFNAASRRWHGMDADPTVRPDDLAATYSLVDVDGAPLPADRVPLMRVYEEGRIEDVEIGFAGPGQPLRLVRASGSQVRGEDGELLGAVVAMVDVTAQRRLESALREAALQDALTGLPNRTLLLDRLRQSLVATGRTGRRMAVLYCDLDGFKPVNDVHGHAVGDEVLVDAGRRLQAAVRPGDTVARTGGDEFVVLCPTVGDEWTAQEVAERVSRSFEHPLRSADGGEHAVGISIGVALCDATDTAESALVAADTAMYRVKAARRSARLP